MDELVEAEAVCGPMATEVDKDDGIDKELFALFDILGMFLMAVVFMGLDTRFDNDLIGDCSSNATSGATTVVEL